MRKIKEWETASGQRAKNNGIERRNKENVHVQRYCPQENNNNKNHKTAVVGRGKIWRSSRSLSPGKESHLAGIRLRREQFHSVGLRVQLLSLRRLAFGGHNSGLCLVITTF